MTVIRPSLARRLILVASGGVVLGGAGLLGGIWAALAALHLCVAALLVAAWVAGARVWPPSEPGVARRFGADPGSVEAAVAKGRANAQLRIGVLGDIQNGISELADVLDALRGLKVDFVLQLGDAANSGLPGRYAVLRRMFDVHLPGIPVLAVPGNHDVGRECVTDVWREWVGPPEWRVDVRGWRLVGLDDAGGPISAASMELLAAVAKEPHAACGTILVAHRPLAPPSDAGARDATRDRTRQLASVGVVPTLTLAGHGHTNDVSTDDAGTVHHVIGENCDRSSAAIDPPVTVGLLTLTPAGYGDGAGRFRLDLVQIPRRVRVRHEFLRVAVGSLYPALRTHPIVTWLGVAAALAAGVAAACAARG